MSFALITEPFARPPRRFDPGSSDEWSDTAAVDKDLDLGELSWQRLDSAVVDLEGLSRVDIDHCQLKNVTFVNVEEATIGFSSSVVDNSDLSRLKIEAVSQCRFDGIKFAGTDFSDGSIEDTEFNSCIFRLASLRLARLERVLFEGCTLDDVDAYASHMEDVAFDGSELRDLSIDQLRAARVDLRGCTAVGLTNIGRLDGFLVSEHQLYPLAPALALAAGLTIHSGALESED